MEINVSWKICEADIYFAKNPWINDIYSLIFHFMRIVEYTWVKFYIFAHY